MHQRFQLIVHQRKSSKFFGVNFMKKNDFRYLQAFAMTAFVSFEILITTTEKGMSIRSSNESNCHYTVTKSLNKTNTRNTFGKNRSLNSRMKSLEEVSYFHFRKIFLERLRHEFNEYRSHELDQP